MAQVSKTKILEASEGIEKEYDEMTSELLIMISKYLKPNNDILNYANQKLSQTEKVNAEALKIISKHAKNTRKEISDALNEVQDIALEDIEPLLSESIDKDVPSVEDSVALNYLKYVATTLILNKLKEVNQTTFLSVSDVYQSAVNNVANKISAEMTRQSQDIEWRLIEEGINEIVVDREVCMKAVSNTVQKMADEGITGFVTVSGRQWHTDTYSAMVMRTEAHNYAIDCVRERQADYGSDLFQVSSHSGARPLCYPYQSKICSWSAQSGGTFVDGAGITYDYLSLENETSYGEPAGLFGINCGHFPLPIIPNVSIVHEQPVQPKEENDREYQESQKQRYLEREIRQAKRDYEMQKVSGADQKTLKEYRKNVSQKQEDMRTFISETGRTRRYDREQIFENSIPLSKNANVGIGEKFENKATKIPQGISLFNSRSNLAKWSQKIGIDGDFFNVSTHGGSDGVTFNSASNTITLDELVDLIRKSPNYSEGQPIRLLACYTGAYDEDLETTYAQLLANKMNVIVKAPASVIRIYEDGDLKIGTRRGRSQTFKVFRPEEVIND